MDNLTAGNPVAHRIRVYYEDSTTIKEGQPVAYNYDTTTNWFGGNVSEVGVATTSTTTAEGSQNEGKYIRVEDITADNTEFFAGVIARGGWVDETGPRVVDIYVPNGAIVPIWTDKSIVIKDRLYLEHGEITLVNATQVGMGLCIATSFETVDRTSPAGICLAKLHGASESSVHGGTLGVGLSEALWEDCPIKEIERNPGLGIVYFDDFVGMQNTVDAQGWEDSSTTSGTLSLAADEGGALVCDSAGNNAIDDGAEWQLLTCRFLPKAGNTIWFEARVKMNDATDQYFIGLAATDVTLMASGVLDNVVDKCGFYHEATSTNNKISSVTAKTSAADKTTDVGDNDDNSYITLGFRISGVDTVEFYRNGVLVETGSTGSNIPTAAMCLSLVAKVEVADADAEMTVDWVKIVQLGARA